MIRMQTRTWNNLIIFLMLGMLTLFFVMNQKINTPRDVEAQLLFPHDMRITQWQFEDIVLQRQSNGQFTQTQGTQLATAQINQLIAGWETAVIGSEPFTLTPSDESPIIYLTNEPVIMTSTDQIEANARTIYIRLARYSDQDFVQLNERFYLLVKPQSPLLLPL